jgi:ABC-type polysaccharide/polyol phosphate export permease
VTTTIITDSTTLFAMLLRRERRHLAVIAANSLLMPACICYSAFMLAPEQAGVRRTWVLGALVLGLGTAALSQVYMGIAQDRLRGTLTLLRAMGTSRPAYIVSYLIYGSALAIGVAIALTGVLFVGGLVPADARVGLRILAVAAVAGFSLAGLGAAIGAHAENFGTGDLIAGASSFGLTLVSPVFYSSDGLWAPVRALSWASPYTHIARLLQATLAGAALPPEHLLALVLFGAAGAVAALWGRSR